MLGWFKKKLGSKKEDKNKELLPDEGAVIDEKDSLAVDSVIDEGTTEPVIESEQEAKGADAPDEVDGGQEASLPDEPQEEQDSEEQSIEETKETTAPEKSEDKSKQTQGGLFSRLKERLSKTRESFVDRLDSIFLGKKVIDEELLDELEEVLITSDLGVQTVDELLDGARKQLKRNELADSEALYENLKEQIFQYLHRADKPAEMVMPEEGPFVIMVLGVNGVGKTTTIGKLAHKFKQTGQEVLLVAADTFRAAAIDQLKLWATRVGVDICAQTQGADPSSVVFDAMEYAQKRKFDVIIVDTAGRIHTKVNLMEELKKIKRVMAKKMPDAPHEVMLVLDSTTGQNAVSQASQFNKAVDLTGLTLTKLDGTAKGGIVVNISRELNIPIRFIGIGEQMEDLRDFHPEEFVEALFTR